MMQFWIILIMVTGDALNLYSPDYLCAQKRIEAPGERTKGLWKFSPCTAGQTPTSPISKVMQVSPLGQTQGQTQAPLQPLPCSTCLGLTASQTHLTEHQETPHHQQQFFIMLGVKRVWVRPVSDICPAMECFKHGFVLVPCRDVGGSLSTLILLLLK